MECAVCGEPSVGYWCSEEHHQKWYAEHAHPKPVAKSSVVWGAFAREFYRTSDVQSA